MKKAPLPRGSFRQRISAAGHINKEGFNMADTDINVFVCALSRAATGGEPVILPKMSGKDFGRLVLAIKQKARRS